jgi:hypothetical protein
MRGKAFLSSPSGKSIVRYTRPCLGAYDEVIASASQMAIKGSKAVQTLAEQNPSLFNTAKHFLERFSDYIDRAFKGIDTTRYEAKALMDSSGQMLENVQRLWDNSLLAALEGKGWQVDRPSRGEVETQTKQTRQTIELPDIQADTQADIQTETQAAPQVEAQVETQAEAEAKFSLREYDQSQKDNWANSKRIVLYEGTEQLYDFIEKSADPTFNKKLYFGAITKEHAQFIYDKTGVDVEGYNLALAADEIRKIFKDHGNVETEALRGLQAIKEKDLATIVDVVQSPDEVKLSKNQKAGKPVLEFYKDIKGKTVVITVVSDRTNDLWVQTMYKYKQKRNLAKTPDVHAPDFTSETVLGTAPSNDIVSDNDADVKTKYDLRSPIEETKDLIAVHNLSENNLRKSLELGGFAMPSVAVTKADIGHENFGEISVLFDKGTIDPQANRDNKVYSRDAWTPTFPVIGAKIDVKQAERVGEYITSLVDNQTDKQLIQGDFSPYNLEMEMNRRGDWVDERKRKQRYIAAYLKSQNYPSLPSDAKYTSDFDKWLKQNGTNFQAVGDWIDALMKPVIVKRGIRNKKDTFTPIGNRRSFESLHYPVTLENVVLAMRGQMEKGGNNPISRNPISSLSETYQSIDAIKRDAGRIRYEADFSETVKILNNKIIDISSNIADSYGDIRAAHITIAEAFDKGKTTPKELHSYINKELNNTYGFMGMKITMEDAQALSDIAQQVRALPTTFFEAKPRRAVEFDEVRAVIVPEGTSQGTLDALSDRGIEYVTYNPFIEGDRKAKVSQVAEQKGLLFDLRGGDLQSKREVLIDMLDNQDLSVADRNRLELYRKKVSNLQANEDTLAQLRGEYEALKARERGGQELGLSAKSRLAGLETEIGKLNRQVENLDMDLLKFEAMEPIDRLYKREVAKHEKMAKDDYNQWITRYRDERKQRDRSRIAKNKIERAANGLKTALINPTNQKYVPEGMRRVVTDLISSIDMGNTQYERNVLKGEGISKKAQNWRESMARLADISARHDAVANFGDDSASNIYFDPDLRAEINELLDKTRGELRYQDMALEQQEQLADILTEVHRAVNDANKMVMENRNMDEPSLKTIQELEQRKQYKLKKGAIGVMDQILTSDFVDSFTFAQAFGEEGRKILGLLQHEGFGKLVEIKYKSHFFVF